MSAAGDGNTDTPAISESPSRISRSLLRKVLLLYQEKLYGIWPMLAADDLLHQLDTESENCETYALITALCGATLSHLNLAIPDGDEAMDSDQNNRRTPLLLTADLFIQESRDSRARFDYMEHVSLNSVLTSYFLHIFYGRQLSRSRTAAFYIREAITFANLLGMHIEETYMQQRIKERQIMRKLYFLLFMTERYLCIRDGLPTVLEPINLPTTESENNPDLVSGFVNLVTLFSTPDNDFFTKWTAQGSHVSLSTKQLLLIQRELQLPVDIPNCVNDIQKVDIVATQHWLRSLTWKLSIQLGYVLPGTGRQEMSVEYPVKIAQDALRSLLPLSTALQVHGPGMETKMYEITSAVADSILCQPVEEYQSSALVVSPRETLKGLADLLFSIPVMNPELRPLVSQKLERIFSASSIPLVLEHDDSGMGELDIAVVNQDDHDLDPLQIDHFGFLDFF